MRPIEKKLKRYGWSERHAYLTACSAGLAVCLAILFTWKPLPAQELTFHVEPAVALWLDDPQATRFSPGFYLALRPGLSLGRGVTLQLSYGLLMVPAEDSYTEDGAAHFMMAGVRFSPLPFFQSSKQHKGGIFFDANAGSVRTGGLNRFAFDAGAGYDFQVTSWFALAPVIRYVQVVQPDKKNNQDANDAQFLTIGLDFSFGSSNKNKENAVCPPLLECVQKNYVEKECVQKEQKPKLAAEVKKVPPCPDKDWDGVCNVDDACPDQIGPIATFGCPIDPCGGKPLSLLVQFNFDSAELPPSMYDAQTMYPVLDEVAKAIAQDKACRVCIVGYASEEGEAKHNKTLSVDRAESVRNYLTSHGISQNRTAVTGMGENCQLVPESTLELNRRVEFRRLNEGESCQKSCSK